MSVGASDTHYTHRTGNVEPEGSAGWQSKGEGDWAVFSLRFCVVFHSVHLPGHLGLHSYTMIGRVLFCYDAYLS